MIIAVDFDGTLCKHEFPNIGSPNIELINMLRKLKNEGHKIILNTCRDGKYLIAAISWCQDFGLTFDAINENLLEIKREFFELSNKVYADIYIDDRNYCFKCDKGINIK